MKRKPTSPQLELLHAPELYPSNEPLYDPRRELIALVGQPELVWPEHPVLRACGHTELMRSDPETTRILSRGDNGTRCQACIELDAWPWWEPTRAELTGRTSQQDQQKSGAPDSRAGAPRRRSMR